MKTSVLLPYVDLEPKYLLKKPLLAAFRDFCQNMADTLNKVNLWIRVWFHIRNFNIFRFTTKFCFRKSVNK